MDLFHALEYLWDVGRLVYGPTGAATTRWFQRQEETLGYFEANRERMKDAEWIEQGLFVGSGVIEAGCRAVVGQRLKQSGMRWTVRGANSIIALRCCQISGRWEEFWENRAAVA